VDEDDDVGSAKALPIDHEGTSSLQRLQRWLLVLQRLLPDNAPENEL
jgi:hypothetical protein